MKTLLKQLGPYRGSIVLIVTLMLAGIMLELYLPTLMADLVDTGIAGEDMPYILRTGGWMLVCALLAAGLTIVVSYLTSRVSAGFGRDVRRKLFVKAEGLSLQEFDRFGTSSLITRTTNDIRQVQDVVNMMLGMMTRAPMMLLGGIILAVSRDAKLSLIFLASLPVLALAIFLIVRVAIPLFGSLQAKTDRLNLLLREALIGTRVIRAFNRGEFEKRRFHEANEDYRDTGIKVNKIMAVLFPIMMLVMNFTNVSIVWFGAVRLDQGEMQVGNLMAFLQYAGMILFSLIMLSMAMVMIPRAQASARRINEVLQVSSSIQDSPSGGNQDQTASEAAPILEFKDVAFRYTGAEKAAVERVSFRVNKGETTAIIGSTGAGKTTLLQLVPRFYDAETGSVLVNGRDVRQWPQKELRDLIGYVPQKAMLFRGTIAQNIRFGNGPVDDQVLEDALRISQAKDFVNAMERGAESEISQAGSNLSGGQKQRLSIARALARKPALYLFDDSFSALDYKTDARLREALKEASRHAAVVMVAQRVSSVVHADQIIVLDEGRVVGKGTHDELLATNKVYQEIAASQQTEEESA
ncbi:ABC transporter ATP-binding protein/permease [Paenibacillus sp. N4]|uniref:ABC transporter ATP-binding protein n=1 Tax=Paenibacillus vietnamensis TaxID=2590547 RepID=UPI001CD080EF|nr:ABC transporter ATP-binding protein [Paenibacillus vietnamensis]MCA0757835.1 ABC transporter ATP-binding protein/permease [Paenibacillus vietnamensis]